MMSDFAEALEWLERMANQRTLAPRAAAIQQLIAAQVKRIAELEAENADLRNGLRVMMELALELSPLSAEQVLEIMEEVERERG